MPKIVLFDEKIAREICKAISTSSKGLKRLCAENKDKGWPSRSHIYSWFEDHPSFKDSYARAKQNQIEALVDDIIEIADDTSNDYIEDEKGKIVANHDHINRARLRIDTRKWLAAKLCPRLYGDKNKEDENDAISRLRLENEA